MNSDKPANILMARLAADLLAWLDSSWIIGRIRLHDTVNVFGVFSAAGDRGLWSGYMDSMSICTGVETQEYIDSELRRHNRATIIVPIEANSQITAVLAVGPLNNNRIAPYSCRDMAVIHELCVQMGNLLQARGPEFGGSDDVETVRGMQDRLLPASLPDISGIECAALCESSGQLGGDFFDLAACSNRGLAATIGNVATAGNAGCILMTAVQACQRSLGRRVELPELFSEINRMFYEIAPEKSYATLFSARVYPDLEKLHYVNAGHETSLIVRYNGRVERLEPNAAALGLSQGSAYRQRCVSFGPGDTLIALSEGMAEPATGESAADREAALIRMIRCDRGVRVRDLPARMIGLIESNTRPHSLDRTVVVVHFRTSDRFDPALSLRETVENPRLVAA